MCPFKDLRGNLCLEPWDVGKALTDYVSSVFTKEKDVKHSEVMY